MTAARCPLCGEENRCERAKTERSGECWCVARTFPPELLARAPDASACICARCLDAATPGRADADER